MRGAGLLRSNVSNWPSASYATLDVMYGARQSRSVASPTLESSASGFGPRIRNADSASKFHEHYREFTGLSMKVRQSVLEVLLSDSNINFDFPIRQAGLFGNEFLFFLTSKATERHSSG